MKKTATTLFVAAALVALTGPAFADNAYQPLPFSQDWSNIGLITVNDDWSGVPGVVGFRGDGLTAATGVDPQTVTADDVPGVIDVNANQTNPNGFFTGGATEFELANPTVALTGSGTADAPYLVLHIDASGKQNLVVRYTLLDLEGEGSTDDAIQQVALQFRVGASGSWTNVPAGYVADATTGPLVVPAVTNVVAALPAAANNAPQLQIRIITTNALGNDEWVGVDAIGVAGEDIPVPTLNSTWGKIKDSYRD